MKEEKIIVGVASACSLIAIGAVLFVLPSLYQEINEIHELVMDSVSVFKMETDQAWTQMIDIQAAHSPPSKPRVNPFDSVFRQKRQDFRGLPSYCHCEPPKPRCPPGPPGPPGQPGNQGSPGMRGPAGQDNTHVYSQIECPAHDTGCIQCPRGPSGRPGEPGRPGSPGNSGRPGSPGGKGNDGLGGPPGEAGEPGPAGRPGKPGRPGEAGRPGQRGRGTPGRPGSGGRPGNPGQSGGRGNDGRPGAPGPQGPPGQPGAPGNPGREGSPGRPGVAGVPGPDAAYCPCPHRSSVFVGRTVARSAVRKVARNAAPAPRKTLRKVVYKARRKL